MSLTGSTVRVHLGDRLPTVAIDLSR